MKIQLIFISFLLIFVIPNALGEPVLFDRNFKAEEFTSGISFPVQMDFVGNDLLVLEKGGDVRLMRGGVLYDEPADSWSTMCEAHSEQNEKARHGEAKKVKVF